MDGTAEDVQVRAERVFSGLLPALGIGWVPPLWKKVLDPVFPKWVSNYAFVLVFTTLFPWLMGPLKGVDEVEVEVPSALRKIFKSLPEKFSVPQAVKAERCRFLESTKCASVCVNTCKVPSQEWLYKDFNMKLHIQVGFAVGVFRVLGVFLGFSHTPNTHFGKLAAKLTISYLSHNLSTLNRLLSLCSWMDSWCYETLHSEPNLT
jgi:hypothetical protein